MDRAILRHCPGAGRHDPGAWRTETEGLEAEAESLGDAIREYPSRGPVGCRRNPGPERSSSKRLDSWVVVAHEDVAEEKRSVEDLPLVFIGLTKADGLTGERSPGQEKCALPREAARAVGPSHDDIAAVLRRAWLLGHHASRRLVVLRWRRLSECFVGSLVVVVAAKVIEGALLIVHRRARRRRRVLLERLVHALVAPVLLRFSGLDSLRNDAELDPPHAQTR